MTKTVEERFWAKVEKTNECWLWTARKNDAGYGDFWLSKAKEHYRAHIMSYELLVGPVPEGLELDHLCRVRHCVNPTHLEAVTHKVNCLRGDSPLAHHARKTHCPQGHEYTEENTRMVDTHTGKGRQCRTCHRDRARVANRRANGIEGVGLNERYKKSHCKNGHEFTESNTQFYVSPAGVQQRLCLACRKIKNAKSRKK